MSDAPLDELRRRRAELQALEDAVSYVRRVAQGRADLARDALHRYTGDGDPTPVYVRAGLEAGLRDVLADRLLGAAGDRPPRPVDDHSGHALSSELDELCARHGFGRLDTLDAAQLEALVAALDEFEHRISAQRRTIFAALDAATEQLVERYRTASGAEGEPG